MSSSPIFTNANGSSVAAGHISASSSPKLSTQAPLSAAVTAPQLQGPPSAFITAAPGVHFLSVPSLLSLLPSVPSSLSAASESAATAAAQPSSDDTFLRTLAPRTLLLLSPERPPVRLERWAAGTGVALIHFGLGPCPASVTSPSSTRRRNRSEEDEEEEGTGFAHSVPGHEDRLGAHGAEPGLGGNQDRMCNEALAIVLQAARAPLIILDFSGANEGALLVGCLRRLQRRNLASIISEYRTIAGPRAQAAHERFIEMFDTSAVAIPEASQLPDWFAQQLEDDEAEAAALAAAATRGSPASTAE